MKLWGRIFILPIGTELIIISILQIKIGQSIWIKTICLPILQNLNGMSVLDSKKKDSLDEPKNMVSRKNILSLHKWSWSCNIWLFLKGFIFKRKHLTHVYFLMPFRPITRLKVLLALIKCTYMKSIGKISIWNKLASISSRLSLATISHFVIIISKWYCCVLLSDSTTIGSQLS